MAIEQERWLRIGTGVASRLLLVLLSAFAGALLGTLCVRLFVRQSGMGWDQLADALGGFMLGGLVGLVGGTIAAFRFDFRGRMITIAVAAGIVMASLAAFRLTAETRQTPEPLVREEPFRPWFLVTVNVGHSRDVLSGVRPGLEPVPFTEASVWSAAPEFVHQGWGPDFRRCMAEPAIGDLRYLLPFVTAAADEAGAGACRTPRDGDLGVVITFSRENERASARIESDCLTERPALVRLADAIEAIAQHLCAIEQ